MNIKKQLRKIRDYVEELETLSDKEHEELRQYQLAAYKFVKFELPDNMAREEFKALLDDTMFVGGNFSGDDVMEKIVNNEWVPIEHEHPEYAKVVDENARLREALRWHPVSELPRTEVENIWTVNVLMKPTYKDNAIVAYYSIKRNRWFDYNKSIILEVNDKSRWCYIPEDKDGE
jgi:carboxypeptidase C (cathepsin A)